MGGRDFDSIYNDHVKLVYWAAYGILKEREAALDVTQNVFLKVFERLNKLASADDGYLRAWLYRVATNAALDVLRRNKRQLPVEDADVDIAAEESELPENIMLDKEMRERVRAGVDALPHIYREAVLLYYFTGLNYEQMTAILNISDGTLKSRMSRARKLLTGLLKEVDRVG